MNWRNISKTGVDLIKGLTEGGSSPNNNSESKGDSPAYKKIYSDSLEALIETLIQDGSIDEDEMNILRKKAEKEGYDADEVEIVVRKRMKSISKNIQESDPYFGLNEAQKLAKMINDVQKDSKNGLGKDLLSGVLNLATSSAGIPIPLGDLLEAEKEDEENLNKLKEIAIIITTFPLPDETQSLEDIAEVLINYMEPQLFREERRSREDAEEELQLIKESPDLNASFMKLNKIKEHPKATPLLIKRITDFLYPPVSKKRFGLF